MKAIFVNDNLPHGVEKSAHLKEVAEKGLGSWVTGKNGNQALLVGAAGLPNNTGSLDEVDYFVVYFVRTYGASPNVISVMRQLPASKVVILACPCFNEAVMRKYDLGKEHWVLCECGGVQTTIGLYDTFLDRGEVLPSWWWAAADAKTEHAESSASYSPKP